MFARFIPLPLADWDFRTDNPLVSAGQHNFALQEMGGAVTFYDEGMYLERGQWLRIPRQSAPELAIHGLGAQVTVIARIKRQPQPETYDCETIAGVWDESRLKRQYCLFLDLPIWDSSDQVGGHVSSHGGPTLGYEYCMDAAIGRTVVTFDQWHTVAFTYDGEYAAAYLDGVLDERDGRNPFAYPDGLFDGGDDGADFTVGAVSRSGEPGNFFHGTLSNLAVLDVALAPRQIAQIHGFWSAG
jgi:hypothetical protein